jgi:uncharacterized protein (DUF2141 family)
MKILTTIIAGIMILMSFKTIHSNNYSLTVKVLDLRNSKGVVQFTLYNKDGTIPDEKFEKYYQQKSADIYKNASTVTFNNLPKGKYAINILHDENENKKIDKGWIMPIEGIGFSNFKTINITNRPNFNKACFIIDSDIVKQIKMLYF